MQNSVTRLGNFWKFLATDFLRKVSQLFNNFRGYFENIILKVKTAVSTFWATFVEIWVTFYSNIWSHWFTVRLTANSNQKLFSTSEERNKKSFWLFQHFLLLILDWGVFWHTHRLDYSKITTQIGGQFWYILFSCGTGLVHPLIFYLCYLGRPPVCRSYLMSDIWKVILETTWRIHSSFSFIWMQLRYQILKQTRRAQIGAWTQP